MCNCYLLPVPWGHALLTKQPVVLLRLCDEKRKKRERTNELIMQSNSQALWQVHSEAEWLERIVTFLLSTVETTGTLH